MMKKLMEFLLPKERRERPEPRPEVNDAVLARLSEHDQVYRCLCDHAYERAQAAMLNAIQPDLTPEVRAFRCGAAYEVSGFLFAVENLRERAKAHQEEERRVQERRQRET